MMQTAHLHTITNLRALKPLLLLLLFCSMSTQVWGNTASSANSSDDVNGGKIVFSGNHATFTFEASGTTITNAGWPTYTYELGSISHGKTKECTFTWEANDGCTIKVTKIEFGVRGYTALATRTSEMKATFNETTKNIGSIGTSYTTFSETNNNGFSSGIKLTLKNTCGGHGLFTKSYDTYDYYIGNISITYTITPNAPGAVATTHTIYATLNTGSIADDEKLQLNTSSCFTMPGNDSHFYETLSYYRSAAAGTDGTKSNVSNNYFYATQVGTYYVKAKIAAKTNCHAESSYSGNITINVIGHPSSLTMRNDGEVFVKVKEGIAASQLDLNTLIESQTGDGTVSYNVIGSNKDKATISGTTFSAVECGEYMIEATAGASNKYAAMTTPATFKVKVKKITPTVTTNPTASNVTYLESLATSTISGGEVTWNGYKVTGDFSWVDNTIAPTTGNSYEVQFTPTGDDANRFNKPENVNIPVTINPIDQEITWSLIANQEYASGTQMDARSTGMADEDTLTMRYFTNNRDWAYIDATNHLQVVVANKEVQITAWQGGNAHWNRVDSTRTIITAGIKPNDTTEITARGITYGQPLNASKLEGKVYVSNNGDKSEVLGTLKWVDSLYVPKAGTGINAKKYKVKFTPNDGGYSPITFLVKVEVDKATPIINWHITKDLYENSTYSNIAESSNKETSLGISESSIYLSVVGLNLTTDEIGDNKTDSITITATQVASDNYKAISVQKKIVIHPKSIVCLPVNISEAEDTTIIKSMGAAYKGTISWCESTEPATGKVAFVPAKYTQHYGLQLGDWTEGLNNFINDFYEDLNWWDMLGGVFIKAIDALKNKELPGTDKMIELNFTGVPDSLSFNTKLQKVYYDMDLDISSNDWKEANQENPTWKVYEISIGGDKETLIGTYNASTTTSIKVPLDSTTRSVKIVLNSPFAGFIQNLTISQRKYIRAKESGLEFGTNERPLQDPQTLNIYYSSVGSCEFKNDTILVTTTNPAFYVDKDTILSNVGLDQVGEDVVRVRCNDVNVPNAHVIFRAKHSGAEFSVPVHSEKPTITSLTTTFKTGTEYPSNEGAYRTKSPHNFAACFNGSPVFDSLYVYGVSESDTISRKWVYSDAEGYNVPEVTSSNVHTPCFVYKKDGAQYTYVRTFDAATTTLNVSTADKKKKLAFMGYKPASLETTIPAIQISGSNPASVYLNNTEILASGAVLNINGGTDTIFARGTNTLTSAADATIKFISSPSELVVKDNWLNETSGFVALNAHASKPSIELNSANDSVIIKGSQLQLHNSNVSKMAIACKVAGSVHTGRVHIYDGTITGADTLGMPLKTIIDGGTFNSGTVKSYNKKGKAVRPWNSRGDLLARDTVNSIEALPTWYGKTHLTHKDFFYYPMLLDENVCVFNGHTDSLASNKDNWNKIPDVEGSDVIIDSAVVISEPINVNMLIIREQEGKDVSVTIAPTGGLTVGEGGIIGATKDNLILKADSVAKSETKGQTGFLRIDPECEEPMPQATIQLFSIGYYNKKNNSNGGARQNAQWQYVGSPLSSDKIEAASVFTISKIYNWDEEGNTWVNNKTNLKLKPWEGYATTQTKHKDGCLITFAGELVANKSITIPLTSAGSGENMLANSFSAPIDVTKLLPGDFQNTQGTIYIFNTGTYNEALSHQEQNAQNQNTRQVQNYYEAGQLIPIAVGSAKKMAEQFADDKLPKTIAPMQGFSISVDQKGKPASVTFDYSRVVYSATNPNTILRAPKKVTADDEDMPITGTLKLTMQSENWSDRVYMLESEQYSVDYENGYDAPKSESGMSEVFVCTDDKELAINATSSIIGTRIGVRTSDEINYSFHFSYVRAEDDLALLDTETNMTTDIDEGTEYTFYAEPNSEILGRFQIVGRAKAPSTPTGVNEVESDNKVHKFIKDNQLYILKNGVLYNGMGAVVR